MDQPECDDPFLVGEVRRLLRLAGTEQAAAEAAFDALARRVPPNALSQAVMAVTNEYFNERCWWESQWI